MDEEKVKEIIKILYDYEGMLSDGYEFYAGKNDVDKLLREIALDILKTVETKPVKKKKKSESK
jgi:hypothetical protein